MSSCDYQCPQSGIPFRHIPGGSFAMGDLFGDGFDNERPVHEVFLDSYLLGIHPVTQGQWRRIMGENPAHFQLSDDHPVERVSWDDTKAFIARLNGQTDGKYRLPSEAQWEYAARSGGKEEKWPGTSDPKAARECAWFDETADKFTQSVGKLTANGLGLYDMAGNVWELTEDLYFEDAYTRHSPKNPCLTGDKGDRVIRGGSWYTYLFLTRTTDRSIHGQAWRDNFVGFRLLREV